MKTAAIFFVIWSAWFVLRALFFYLNRRTNDPHYWDEHYTGRITHAWICAYGTLAIAFTLYVIYRWYG